MDVQPTKICSRCDQELPATTEHFYKASRHGDRLYPYCKPCSNKAAAKWYRDNPKRARENWRRKYYKKYDGLTVEEYDALVASQNDQCAICNALCDELPKDLTVDHDHISGRVRGLLCHHCNTGLGFFKDDPDRLRKAIQYLGF